MRSIGKKVWPCLVAGTALVVLFVLAGTPRGENQINRWLIGGPKQTDDSALFQAFVGLTVEDGKPVARVEGKRIELDWSDDVAAKTQIPNQFEGSADLIFLFSNNAEEAWFAPSFLAFAIANYGQTIIAEPMIDPADGLLKMNVRNTEADPLLSWEEWYVLDGGYHTFSVSVSVEATLVSEVTEHPIGAPNKTGATHAKEMYAEDSWAVAPGQTVMIDVATEQGNYHFEHVNPGPAIDPITAQMILGFQVEGHFATEAADWMRMQNITWGEVPIDASQLDKVLEPIEVGGSWTGRKPRLWGGGSTIHVELEGVVASARFWDVETVTALNRFSFGGLSVADMDGSRLDDLIICCPAVQRCTGGAWAAVCQTLAEWRAADYTPDWGCYSWDADPPAENALALGSAVYFYIDRASARTFLLEGFQGDVDASGRSFAHDGRIIINGWPLSKTSRAEDPWV